MNWSLGPSEHSYIYYIDQLYKFCSFRILRGEVMSAQGSVCWTCVVQRDRPDLVFCYVRQGRVQIQQQSQEIQQLREQLVAAQS